MKRAVLIVPFIAVFLIGGLPVSGQQNSNPVAAELKSPSASIRAKAARQLGDSGDSSVVPALAADLNDPSAKVRQEIIVALARLHTLPALTALISATKDTDPDVRTLAVRTLVGWYTGNIPSVGFKGMFRRSYHNALNWLQTDITRISPAVRVDPTVVNALVATMQDTRSIGAAREAAYGLGVLLARPAVPALVKSAHSSDADLATNSLDALSKIKDVSAGPQLVDLLDSPSKQVQQAACITVGILRTKSAVPELQQIYQSDSDKSTRQAALDGLAFIGDPASYPVFIKALWSQDKAQRQYAAEGLARARNPKALNDLQKRLSIEKDGGVKLAIQFALASLGETQSLNNLVNALSSRARGDVAQSYLVELARRKKLLTDLYPSLNSGDATIRRRLCVVLMYSGDASSLPYVEHLTHDRNGSVAAEALRAAQAIRARQGASAAS
ncbi:MAG: HEAT repeat domain-containing protein [Terriglobia bacterium]